MRAFVTGGAGFIGSHLTDRLLAQGHAVTVFDNFSTGRHEFLDGARSRSTFSLIQGDLLNLECLTTAIQGHDMVFHLAANADVRFGLDHPRKDLDQNTIATHNLLEAMRLAEVKRIAFSSTGSIYGEPTVFPTPESCPLPIQTSLYGASKLAAEGLISAYATGFGMRAIIFRFVSILGERYTHGHVFDFYRKLRADPEQVEVLGNGRQRKSYLYVQDCLDAIFTALDQDLAPVTVYNLGTNE
jgi:UDP-glucose 4-epimerase